LPSKNNGSLVGMIFVKKILLEDGSNELKHVAIKINLGIKDDTKKCCVGHRLYL
jgi:hypothetical protein